MAHTNCVAQTMFTRMAIAKYYTVVASIKRLIFSDFWQPEVQNQGAVMMVFLRLSLGCLQCLFPVSSHGLSSLSASLISLSVLATLTASF
jgi:hypothetical protein